MWQHAWPAVATSLLQSRVGLVDAKAVGSLGAPAVSAATVVQRLLFVLLAGIDIRWISCFNAVFALALVTVAGGGRYAHAAMGRPDQRRRQRVVPGPVRLWRPGARFEWISGGLLADYAIKASLIRWRFRSGRWHGVLPAADGQPTSEPPASAAAE